jgi:protein-tyrosine-phosphatase
MSANLRVLFVCVHNAARSRMAEAFEVTSAGVTQRIYTGSTPRGTTRN